MCSCCAYSYAIWGTSHLAPSWFEQEHKDKQEYIINMIMVVMINRCADEEDDGAVCKHDEDND